MMKRPLLFSLLTLCLTACATTNPPGPEGTGDHKVGYLLGRSDTVKQEYWIIQDQQKNLHPATQPRINYLSPGLPSRTIPKSRLGGCRDRFGLVPNLSDFLG